MGVRGQEEARDRLDDLREYESPERRQQKKSRRPQPEEKITIFEFQPSRHGWVNTYKANL